MEFAQVINQIHESGKAIAKEECAAPELQGLPSASYSLELSHEEAHRIWQDSMDIICICDFSGRILWSNQAECRITGFSPEELSRAPLMSLIHPDDIEKVRRGLEKSAQGIRENSEIRTLCKDGSYKWISWSGVPFYEEQKIYAIGRDVTSQKLAESMLADFYSITSHELRTPLSSVRGVLSLLENEVVEPGSHEAKKLISMARLSCERLVRLVNDILDLKRIESGTMKLVAAPVEAGDLLEAAMANIAGLSIESEIRIVKELKCNSFALGDKDRLTQVLTNLLSNAIKYSNPGDSVILRAEELGNGSLRFSVIDSGPGIRSDLLPKLFSKFGQLDSSDSRPKEGMGLGLFIARSIIEQHGGRIGITPREGGGCHFWFELKPVIVTFRASQEQSQL